MVLYIIQIFFSKLHLLEGHLKQNKDQLILKSKSHSAPNKLHSCIDIFFTAVDHDIKMSLVKAMSKDNLIKSEREAPRNLQQRDDNWCRRLYQEAIRQLSDTSNYQKLNIDPTELHTEKLKAFINNHKDSEPMHEKL